MSTQDSLKLTGFGRFVPTTITGPDTSAAGIAVAQSSGDHWEMFFPDNAPRLAQVLETFLHPSDPSHL